MSKSKGKTPMVEEPSHVKQLPSNLLISSGGHNFVTPAANFCDQLEGLFHQISKHLLWQIENIFGFFVTFQCFHALF
jgi:hypothetical protein